MIIALYIPTILSLVFYTPLLVVRLWLRIIESLSDIPSKKKLKINLNKLFTYGNYLFSLQALAVTIYFFSIGQLDAGWVSFIQIFYGLLAISAIPSQGNKREWERGILLLWLLGTCTLGPKQLLYPSPAARISLYIVWSLFWTIEFQRQYKGYSNGHLEI